MPYYYWKGDVNHKLENSHTLTVNNGYLYINDHDIPGTKGGVAICDIFTTPDTPRIVGLYDDDYVHDCFVRNDTMWAAEIYTGYCSVVDIRDKTNPKKITDFQTPSRFTHNTWLSDDSKTLFTTDEKPFATVGVYEVNDIFDISLIGQFQSTPGTKVIPHNVRVLNDFLVVSYYTNGVIIADAQDPENIIKTGFYDTSPNYSGGTFNGCWEVYPFFPSGTIAASDIERGLFLFKPEYIRACYLHGIAKDYFTDEPIKDVNINIAISPDTGSTKLASTLSKLNGHFKSGVADAGTDAVWAYKAGYYPVIKSNQVFRNGDTTLVEFRMIADSVDTIGLGIAANPVIPILLYPTLAIDFTRLQIPNNVSSLTGYIYNMSGRIVRPINTKDNRDSYYISTKELTAGRYSLLLRDKEGKFYSAYFIKQ